MWCACGVRVVCARACVCVHVCGVRVVCARACVCVCVHVCGVRVCIMRNLCIPVMVAIELRIINNFYLTKLP